jgi:hypothetical protein
MAVRVVLGLLPEVIATFSILVGGILDPPQFRRQTFLGTNLVLFGMPDPTRPSRWITIVNWTQVRPSKSVSNPFDMNWSLLPEHARTKNWSDYSCAGISEQSRSGNSAKNTLQRVRRRHTMRSVVASVLVLNQAFQTRYCSSTKD